MGDAVMIVTEEQAKQKLCPFARSFNADETYPAKDPICIGSRCMAWDWIDSEDLLPQTFIQHPDGHYGSAGQSLRQGYLTPSSNEYTAETKEEFHERITKVRLEECWIRNEPYAVDSAVGWKKPHPQRRGQCLRAITIEPSQAS